MLMQWEIIPQLEQYRNSICYDSLDVAQIDSDIFFSAVSERLIPKVLLCRLYIDTQLRIDELSSVSMQGEAFAGKALSALDGVHRVIGYVAM